jgi:hypothetical protein
LAESAKSPQANPERSKELKRARQRGYQAKYKRSPKGKATAARYKRSAKGRARYAAYNDSDKGVARTRRYTATPRWREQHKWIERRRRTRVRIEESKI